MADGSAIEWTEATWNPVTGCTKVSPGCAHCYAETFAERWRGVPGHPYEQGFDLRLWPARLEHPLRWKRPRMIFVNSMSDLFHEGVPQEFVARVFDVMVRADQHIFQVLTKRPHGSLDGRAALAVAGERVDGRERSRIGASSARADALREVPAAVRFISAEPLLGPLEGLELDEIDWLIAGGESGPRFRPVKPAVAARAARPLPRGGRRVLLQAMGRHPAQDRRTRARRPHLGRAPDAPSGCAR